MKTVVDVMAAFVALDKQAKIDVVKAAAQMTPWAEIAKYFGTQPSGEGFSDELAASIVDNISAMSLDNEFTIQSSLFLSEIVKVMIANGYQVT